MPEGITPKKTAFDIVGLGMSMIDLLQVVEDFPSGPGVTEVKDSRLMGGGPVPTALCAASRLGAKCAVLDRIGADWRGDLVAAEYERYGVDCSHLILEKGKSTTFGSVLVREKDGERHVVFSPGDFSPLESGELPHDFLTSAGILHMNARHWPACLDAARAAKAAGAKISFDGGANRYDSKFLELLPMVNILIVARDFAERLSGSVARDVQLDALSQWNAEVVGITDGANGSWFRAGGVEFHQAAFPVSPVVDTTGCGDVFHGAFLAALSRGDDFRSCARFASAAAALNATALGGRGNLATSNEVRGLIAGGE